MVRKNMTSFDENLSKTNNFKLYLYWIIIDSKPILTTHRKISIKGAVRAPLIWVILSEYD